MGELFLFIFCKLADQSFTNSHRRVMMFNQFRIPSTALLNRTGDVNEQGNYVSPFKDKKKRLGKHHRMNEWPFFFFFQFCALSIWFMLQVPRLAVYRTGG